MDIDDAARAEALRRMTNAIALQMDVYTQPQESIRDFLESLPPASLYMLIDGYTQLANYFLESFAQAEPSANGTDNTHVKFLILQNIIHQMEEQARG